MKPSNHEFGEAYAESLHRAKMMWYLYEMRVIADEIDADQLQGLTPEQQELADRRVITGRANDSMLVDFEQLDWGVMNDEPPLHGVDHLYIRFPQAEDAAHTPRGISDIFLEVVSEEGNVERYLLNIDGLFAYEGRYDIYKMPEQVLGSRYGILQGETSYRSFLTAPALEELLHADNQGFRLQKPQSH